MGVAELIEQKSFLGTEFLTWLWARSEWEGGRIELPEEDPVEVSFEDSLVLEAEVGEARIQTLRGDAPGMSAEARQALVQGKKARRAKMRLNQGEFEWNFTLRGDTFDFASIRIPAPKGLPIDESIPLRLQAAERLFRLIEAMFEAFLKLRLDEKAWGAELKKIHEWVEEK